MILISVLFIVVAFVVGFILGEQQGMLRAFSWIKEMMKEIREDG